MAKQQTQKALDRLLILQGQKLQKVLRAGAMVNFEFGDLFESERHVKDEAGNWVTEPCMAAKYALHIDCSFRIVCGDKIILAKYDLYQPTSEQLKNQDFDWDSFDWDIPGQNKFDELSKKYFLDSTLTVKKISISRFGDLKIKFDDDFILEIFSDISGNEECWRFFENGNADDKHLVISGEGIDEN